MVNIPDKLLLIFVSTSEEAETAVHLVKTNSDLVVLASTPVAQNILAKNNLNFTNYIKLLPKLSEFKKIVNRANEFAVGWFLNTPMESLLEKDGVNLVYYLVSYWTNLLIPLLLSQYIIKKSVALYKPTQILYFPDRQIPEKDKNADNYILTTCGQNIVGHHILLTPISTTVTKLQYKENQLIKNILILFNYKTDLPIILKIILQHYLRKIKISRPTFKKADIIIYADAYHLTNSISLIKTLKKTFSVQVLGELLSVDQYIRLIKAGIFFETFKDLEMPPSNTKELAKIHNGWGKFCSSKGYRDLLKKFFLDELEPIITEGFTWYFNHHMPNVLITLKQTETLVKAIQPKAILLFGNWGKKGLSFSYSIKQNGGKVFILEHGIFSEPLQIHPPIYDYMLFWGKADRNNLIRYFREPMEKLGIVGWFLPDNIFTQMKSYKKAIYKQPNIPINNLIILLVTSFGYNNIPRQLKVITQIVEHLNKTGIKELIIRPHPGEELPHDLPIDTTGDFQLTWDLDKDLDVQIKKADIVITEGTSVALRAMMWGKPLIHLVTEGIVDITKFSKHGAAIEVKDIRNLSTVIKLLSQNKIARQKMSRGQEKRLNDYCYRVDGQAAKRIVSFLNKFC